MAAFVFHNIKEFGCPFASFVTTGACNAIHSPTRLASTMPAMKPCPHDGESSINVC